MKKNTLKLVAVTAFAMLLLAFVVFGGPSTTGTVTKADEIEASYKKQCAMCHKADASKFFPGTEPDAEMVQIILNGKKGAKPPNMPGYEKKGMTAEEAQGLVTYMRQLSGIAAPESEPESNSNSNCESNTNVEPCA
jgi:mono/diheme cytochrome c family protein